MTESQLQQKILNFCKSTGILAYKLASPSRRGVPDLMLIANGRTIFYELKHPNGKGVLSALQKVTIKQMQDHGAEVYVGHDYQEIIATIRDRLNV